MIHVAPPAVIEELTHTALDYVARAVGVPLDFSAETLALLDHYTRSVAPTLEGNPALADIVAPALGAYFGEVVRARFDGFWRVESANQRDWLLCSHIAFLAFNPIGVAYDALYGTGEHHGPGSNLRVAPEDRALIDARLTSIPPVAEDEYFLFTTRFEVLEIVVEALCGKMEDEGYGETRYSEADYG
ncbi:MAG TPA: hypothetical protein VER33_16255 [Polyangiaceae bacterium]|nr:hypothetical protein [Polyangiaceae bacterium]